MIPTGDVQGGIRKLETLIRAIKYSGPVNYNSLSSGDPAAFLPLVGHAFTSFSPAVTEHLVASGFELTGKTDLRFTETVYKVLRDVFQYKPVLSKEQFLQWGFAQRKISVVCDILNLVLQRHKKAKPRSRFPASHKKVKVETISYADLEKAVPTTPFVVNHLENPSTIPASFSHRKQTPSSNIGTSSAPVETFSSPSSEPEEFRGAEEEQTADKPCCVELEGRLSALETRVEGLVSGLERLGVLEQRLEELERLKNKDKTEEQCIAVSREAWENLLSRVLLLETKLELSSAKENVPPPFSPSPTSFGLNVLGDVPQSSVRCPASSERQEAEELQEPDSQDDLKERLERITNMLKSTSSLLKNTDNYS